MQLPKIKGGATMHMPGPSHDPYIKG